MSEQQRKAFESTKRFVHGQMDARICPESGAYLDPDVEHDWLVWKAAWDSALSHGEGEAVEWREGWPQNDGEGGICHIPLNGYPDYMVVAFNVDGELEDGAGDDVGYCLPDVKRWRPIGAPQVAVPEVSETALRRAALFLDGLRSGGKEVRTLRKLLAATAPAAPAGQDHAAELCAAAEMMAGWFESAAEDAGWTRENANAAWAAHTVSRAAIRRYQDGEAVPTAPAREPETVTLDQHDREMTQVIEERDEYHDIADKLADAIAEHLGVEIGEHSSANCPWANALEAMANADPAQQPVSDPDGLPSGWRSELERIRDLIAGAPEDALGSGEAAGCAPWPIRDEVVHNLTQILTAPAPDEREIAAYRSSLQRIAAPWHGGPEKGAKDRRRLAQEALNQGTRLRAGKEGE